MHIEPSRPSEREHRLIGNQLEGGRAEPVAPELSERRMSLQERCDAYMRYLRGELRGLPQDARANLQAGIGQRMASVVDKQWKPVRLRTGDEMLHRTLIRAAPGSTVTVTFMGEDGEPEHEVDVGPDDTVVGHFRTDGYKIFRNPRTGLITVWSRTESDMTGETQETQEPQTQSR